jgi:aspartokinase
VDSRSVSPRNDAVAVSEQSGAEHIGKSVVVSTHQEEHIRVTDTVVSLQERISLPQFNKMLRKEDVKSCWVRTRSMLLREALLVLEKLYWLGLKRLRLQSSSFDQRDVM